MHREINLFVEFLPEEANAMQESHNLGNYTPVLTVKEWSMMTEQCIT